MARQGILYGLIESALSAAAGESVTAVKRDWDYYPPGDSAQPLAPFLVVGITDDIPYGIGIDLYRCMVQVMVAVADSPDIRSDFDALLGVVRSVMASVRGLSADGLVIGGALEQSCTQPASITESGDIIYAQTVTFLLRFEYTPPSSTTNNNPSAGAS